MADETPKNRQTDTGRAFRLVQFQVAVMALGLVSGVLVARLLGPADRGIFALVFIPCQVLASLGASGFVDASMYEASRDPSRRLDVLKTIVVLGAVVSAAGLVILGGIWFAAKGSLLQSVSFDAYALASVSMPFFAWIALAGGYLFATGRTAASQTPLVVERIVGAGGAAGVFLLDGDLMGVIAVNVVSPFLAALLTVRLIGASELAAALRRDWERGLASDMSSYAGRMVLSNLAQKLTFRIDQLIINALAGPATVGIYAVAARVAEVPLMGPRALRQSWFATRASAAGADQRAATLAGHRKLLILMALGIPAFGLFGAFVIPFAYGDDFSSAVAPFLILLVGTYALSASMAFVSALSGSGKPQKLAVASWIGLVAVLALDLALVPPLGTEGGALASAVAYTIFSLAVFWQWRGDQPDRAVRVAETLPRAADARALAASLRRR